MLEDSNRQWNLHKWAIKRVPNCPQTIATLQPNAARINHRQTRNRLNHLNPQCVIWQNNPRNWVIFITMITLAFVINDKSLKSSSMKYRLHFQFRSIKCKILFYLSTTSDDIIALALEIMNVNNDVPIPENFFPNKNCNNLKLSGSIQNRKLDRNWIVCTVGVTNTKDKRSDYSWKWIKVCTDQLTITCPKKSKKSLKLKFIHQIFHRSTHKCTTQMKLLFLKLKCMHQSIHKDVTYTLGIILGGGLQTDLKMVSV